MHVAELGLRPNVDRPVRAGRVAFADDALTMIMGRRQTYGQGLVAVRLVIE